jgi:hypothetical protein
MQTFLPPPAFLRATLPHFYAADGDNLAFVQARWEHLNRDYSPLTRGQALALDGHFAIEQAGRQAAGYMLGFNGSAGVWRRAAIEDPAVGGWQQDTLCEDLDLSYRAQLAGWRARYCNELEAPAEIPPQLAAYKRQQFRWAKGSIQTLRKLGGRVGRSARPPGQRIAGLVHLASYLVHPLLLLLLLVIPPILLLGGEPISPIPLVGLTSLGAAAALCRGPVASAPQPLAAELAAPPAVDPARAGRLPQQHPRRLARLVDARRRIPAHAQVSRSSTRVRAGAPAPIGCLSTASCWVNCCWSATACSPPT